MEAHRHQAWQAAEAAGRVYHERASGETLVHLDVSALHTAAELQAACERAAHALASCSTRGHSRHTPRAAGQPRQHRSSAGRGSPGEAYPNCSIALSYGPSHARHAAVLLAGAGEQLRQLRPGWVLGMQPSGGDGEHTASAAEHMSVCLHAMPVDMLPCLAPGAALQEVLVTRCCDPAHAATALGRALARGAVAALQLAPSTSAHWTGIRAIARVRRHLMHEGWDVWALPLAGEDDPGLEPSMPGSRLPDGGAAAAHHHVHVFEPAPGHLGTHEHPPRMLLFVCALPL
jgi:hypothetical protein